MWSFKHSSCCSLWLPEKVREKIPERFQRQHDPPEQLHGSWGQTHHPSVTGARGKLMGFNKSSPCKLLESRTPLCLPLSQTTACPSNISKAVRCVGILQVPLGTLAELMHNPWWAATLLLSSSNQAILSTTTVEGGMKTTEGLHQNWYYPSCKVYWFPHWELPPLRHNLYMCLYDKELTAGTNEHGKIPHGSRKK